jgi:hypothetical protein
MISSPNGTGGSLGKYTAPSRVLYLIGNYRTVTRLRVTADLLRALWPKIACGLMSAIAAGTLVYVGSG